MQLDKLLVALSRVALFQGLNASQLADIARCVKQTKLVAGQAIITDGDIGSSAFLLLSGHAVRLSDDDNAGDDEAIEAGSLIGEMAMLVEVEHSSTVEARGPVVVLEIARAALAELMMEQPEVAEHFVETVSGRLRTMAYTLREIDRTLNAPPPVSMSNRIQQEPVALH